METCLVHALDDVVEEERIDRFGQRVACKRCLRTRECLHINEHTSIHRCKSDRTERAMVYVSICGRSAK